jgi:hypothetical protein
MSVTEHTSHSKPQLLLQNILSLHVNTKPLTADRTCEYLWHNCRGYMDHCSFAIPSDFVFSGSVQKGLDGSSLQKMKTWCQLPSPGSRWLLSVYYKPWYKPCYYAGATDYMLMVSIWKSDVYHLLLLWHVYLKIKVWSMTQDCSFALFIENSFHILCFVHNLFVMLFLRHGVNKHFIAMYLMFSVPQY